MGAAFLRTWRFQEEMKVWEERNKGYYSKVLR